MEMAAAEMLYSGKKELKNVNVVFLIHSFFQSKDPNNYVISNGHIRNVFMKPKTPHVLFKVVFCFVEQFSMCVFFDVVLH